MENNNSNIEELTEDESKILDECLFNPKRFNELKNNSNIDISQTTLYRKLQKLTEKNYLEKVPISESMKSGYMTVPENLEELQSEYLSEVQELLEYLEENDYYDRKGNQISIPTDSVLEVLKDVRNNQIVDEAVIYKNNLTKTEKEECDMEILDHLTEILNKLTRRGREVKPKLSKGKIEVTFEGNLESLMVMDDNQKLLDELYRRKSTETPDVQEEVSDTYPQKVVEEPRNCDNCNETIAEGETIYLFENSFDDSELICHACLKRYATLSGIE